jgi:hypothetical protein
MFNKKKEITVIGCNKLHLLLKRVSTPAGVDSAFIRNSTIVLFARYEIVWSEREREIATAPLHSESEESRFT